MQKIVARLHNFGNTPIFEGQSLKKALDHVRQCGLEATIYVDGTPRIVYSSISDQFRFLN